MFVKRLIKRYRIERGVMFAVFIAILFMLLPLQSAYATMKNYCLIPPHVKRGGVPPNIVIAYERGGAIMNRAYSPTYSSTTTYYGFFDSTANYTYDSVNGFFIKPVTACTPSTTINTNCFSGNVLNWALMSSLDLSRKALIGFGTGLASGGLFTYTGTLDSKGQANAATVSAVGYTFCLAAATGTNPTGISIGFGGNCTGTPTVTNGRVIMRFTDENRLGLIQKIGDVDRDLRFDIEGPRFSVRRWNSGNAKQADIMRDSPALTLAERESYFRALLDAISIAPPVDPQAPQLANMMFEISRYFRGVSSAYQDNHAFTQTPYSWADDPLRACRRSFVLYLTTGSDLSGTLSTLPPPCNPLVYPNEEPYISARLAGTTVTDPFAINTCAAFNTDHHTADGTPPRQNISTFVVHTTFYGGGTSAVTRAKLQYAANISDGLYLEVNNPLGLLAALERAVNEMLRRASSGAAASVLASGEGSGANLIQGIFYPETPRTPLGMFDRRVSWIGRLTNYWYYADPLFTSSTILDDSGTTPPDRILNLSNDKKVTFRFSHADNATVADRYNFGPPPTFINTIRFERTINLWDAGVELWRRDVAVGSTTRVKRKIYVTNPVTGTGFLPGNFSQDTVNNDGDNAAALLPFLNLTTVPGDDLNSDRVVNEADARVLIRYIHGEDFPALNLRQRTVAVDLTGDGDTADTGEGARVWKLGDILNSTPKILSWVPLNTYHQKYSDATYGSGTTGGYINTANYRNRGMVFVGGNDGMLHAFKLGRLELVNDRATPNIKARLTNPDTTTPLGHEMWSFIPRNALPYLKYLTDPGYCHVYTVDLTPYIFDASINRPAGCTEPNYWNCTKTVESWRTILIGGMRFGGASRGIASTCTDCVKTPVAGNGFSSYFALDVTDQNNPRFLWEFSNEQLGFTTTGPAIVKINARNAGVTTSTPDTTKNGRWFVVFGSGPTGPNTGYPDYQFMGRSDQNLRLFVLDLKTGALVRTIDTTIPKAFAGSMLNATIDTDSDYQDDVVYIPYVRRTGTSPNLSWTEGGVGRLVTREDLNGNDISATGNTALNPANWAWSVVMDNIGPVTSSVANLINKNRGELWLYFGTGRYYFEQRANTDDATGQRQIFGIKEPCFSTATAGFDSNCTTSRSFCTTPTTSNPCGDLRNVTDIANVPSDPTVAGFNGWYINLDPPGRFTYTEAGRNVTRDYRAERVITDTLTTTTGLVFFTSYKPYSDICAYGGKSFIWATKYDTGGAPGALLKGMALVQVSTGAIEQVDLSRAFTLGAGRKSGALEGVPPTAQGLSIVSTPPPAKRVIHMRER